MDHDEQVTYRVVVKRIVSSRHRVIESMYRLKGSNLEPIGYYKWHALNEVEQAKFERVNVSTGEMRTQEEIVEVYSQAFDDLDGTALVAFLNK